MASPPPRRSSAEHWLRVDGDLPRGSGASAVARNIAFVYSPHCHSQQSASCARRHCRFRASHEIENLQPRRQDSIQSARKKLGDIQKTVYAISDARRDSAIAAARCGRAKRARVSMNGGKSPAREPGVRSAKRLERPTTFAKGPLVGGRNRDRRILERFDPRPCAESRELRGVAARSCARASMLARKFQMSNHSRIRVNISTAARFRIGRSSRPSAMIGRAFRWRMRDRPPAGLAAASG